MSSLIEAGGAHPLRLSLKKKAWSPKPFAKANSEGYWRSLQGACAVILTFETCHGPDMKSPDGHGAAASGVLGPERLGVLIDVASWRECGPLSQHGASQRRWSRVLVAVADAQCRLTNGPEGVLSRKDKSSVQALPRALLHAISRDALALAPFLDLRFWPRSAGMVASREKFFDQAMEPSDRRSLPLVHCRFVGSKPMPADEARQAMGAMKLKLAALFGSSALVEWPTAGQDLSSPNWRSMLEARSISGGLAMQEGSEKAEGVGEQLVSKLSRARL